MEEELREALEVRENETPEEAVQRFWVTYINPQPFSDTPKKYLTKDVIKYLIESLLF
jgi:hypothetical protein